VDPEEALGFLLQAARLKWVPRIGWLLRGVSDPESVAEHAWGVALLALALSEGVEGPLDRGKLLTIALLHDLPEAALSDIPTPALRYLPPQAKRRAEQAAMADLLAPFPEADRLLEWWYEFEEASSPEGRLVRDADRLEMLLQAHLYEQSRGCLLDEFWEGQGERPFHFPASQALYDTLCRHRKGAGGAI